MARRPELASLVRALWRGEADGTDGDASEVVARDGAAARLWRGLTAAALLLLFARAAWVRWELLTASPFPLGVDGYFYPIQVRSLLEHGHLYYPASPLTFWLMAPLAALMGDPILGAKLGAALGGAAVVWPAYALGKRLGGGGGGRGGFGRGRLAGLVAAVIAVSSTGSLLLSAEFVKNAFGVTFGLAALAALLAAVDAPGARRWALAALAFAAALLSHKMATALVLVLGAPPLGAFAFGALRERGARSAASRGAARFAARVVVLGAALVVVLGALGAVAPGRFLSLSHLELLGGLFSGAWRSDAPALVVGTFVLPLGGEAWHAGLVCAAALAALVARAVARRRAAAAAADEGATERAGAAAAPRSRWAAWPIVALGLLIAWPTLNVEDPQGLGFRLRIIAFTPLALAAAVLVGVVADAAAAAPDRGPDRAPGLLWLVLMRARRLAPLVALAALAGWLVAAPTRLDRGVVYAHPAMISAVCALGSAVPPGELVIVSERHIAFMATWYTRLPTAVHPTGDPARRWRLLPLAFIGTSSPLGRAIDAARQRPELVPPRGLHPKHHNGLVVMPEATWQWVLTQLPPAPRRYYEAWRAL